MNERLGTDSLSLTSLLLAACAAVSVVGQAAAAEPLPAELPATDPTATAPVGDGLDPPVPRPGHGPGLRTGKRPGAHM